MLSLSFDPEDEGDVPPKCQLSPNYTCNTRQNSSNSALPQECSIFKGKCKGEAVCAQAHCHEDVCR